MTYGEVKKQVLRLLNQYKIAGTEIPGTYNNQNDYIDRIPGLVNDAMMELATTVRKIETVVRLSTSTWAAQNYTDLGDSYSFMMPSDFFAHKSGDNWLLVDGRPLSHQLLTFRGAKKTLGVLSMSKGVHFVTLPKALVDNHEVLMTYYCYPELLADDAADSTELDNTVDAQRAIPYYVAGMLALHDDPFLASSLMNAWEDKLQKLTPLPYAEVAPVQDAYFFNVGHGLGDWCE